MCLVALAIDERRRVPLALASNRGEQCDRPAVHLAWWTTQPGATAILGGRTTTSTRAGRVSDSPRPAGWHLTPTFAAARPSTPRFSHAEASRPCKSTVGRRRSAARRTSPMAHAAPRPSSPSAATASPSRMRSSAASLRATGGAVLRRVTLRHSLLGRVLGRAAPMTTRGHIRSHEITPDYKRG